MGTKTAAEILTKTPAEAKYYTLDFSAELETGETISSIEEFTVAPTGTTNTTPAISTDQKMVQTKISGGSAGTRYVVTARVQTSVGEILEGQGELVVQS